ncbi:MAG: DUF3592 domain-containing protein [Spirochaetia bacterium]|nr:DUF3592 domain-containing protein [Spirochaetia bacterium]
MKKFHFFFHSAVFAVIFFPAVLATQSLSEAESWLRSLGYTYTAKNMRTLAWLDLSKKKFNNEDLKYLQNLPALKKLDLRESTLSNKGLGYIVQLKNLEVLWISKTILTDAGVDQLKSMTNLRELDLPENISPEKARELEKILGKTRVTVEGESIPSEDDEAATTFLIALSIILLGIFFGIPFYILKSVKYYQRVLFSAGLILMMIWITLFVSFINSDRSSVITHGRVVDIKHKKVRVLFDDSASSVSQVRIEDRYYPVIVFNTKEGEKITFQSEHGFKENDYEINQPVEVSYNSEKPQKAVINKTSIRLGPYLGYVFTSLIWIMLLSLSGVFNPLYMRIRQSVQNLLNR